MSQEHLHRRGSRVDPDTLLPVNPARHDQIIKQRRARKERSKKRIGKLKRQGRKIG